MHRQATLARRLPPPRNNEPRVADASSPPVLATTNPNAGADAGTAPLAPIEAPAPGCDLTAITSCGACDNDCTALQNAGRNTRPESIACVNGACQLGADPCREGYADCDGALGCETALSEAENCGACGNTCAAPLSLCASSGGAFECVADCGAGEQVCDNACTNVDADRNHCGECGRACFNNAGCAAGSCVCGDGFVGDGQLCCRVDQAVMDGACVNLSGGGEACTSDRDCLSGLSCEGNLCCAEQCGENEVCNAGGTACQCAEDATRVNGSCVPRSGLGESCQSSDCEAGLHCVQDLCCTAACEAAASQTCGQTGSCSANGQGCELCSTSTICRRAGCSAQDGEATAQALCDGNGSCRAPEVTDCGGHQCSANLCDTNCNGEDEQCVGGRICVGGDCVAPQCETADDCRPVVGQCTDGRCVQDSIVADATACDPSVTTVTAGRGTLATPYCTPQLAVNHATAFGFAKVLLRGTFTTGAAINGNLAIVGDPALPAVLTGDDTGVAIDVLGALVVSISDVTIEGWSTGIRMAEGSVGKMTRVNIRDSGLNLRLEFGEYTLTDIVVDGGNGVYPRGNVVAQDLVLLDLDIGFVFGGGGDLIFRNSRVERCGASNLAALDIVSASSVTIENSEFIDNPNAIYLTLEDNSVPAHINGNIFENGGEDSTIGCSGNAWFVGDNTFVDGSESFRCTQNRAANQ